MQSCAKRFMMHGKRRWQRRHLICTALNRWLRNWVLLRRGYGRSPQAGALALISAGVRRGYSAAPILRRCVTANQDGPPNRISHTPPTPGSAAIHYAVEPGGSLSATLLASTGTDGP